LSFQPGLRRSNDLRFGRKMATFQLFFQSGRAKDLSAPPYWTTYMHFFSSPQIMPFRSISKSSSTLLVCSRHTWYQLLFYTEFFIGILCSHYYASYMSSSSQNCILNYLITQSYPMNHEIPVYVIFSLATSVLPQDVFLKTSSRWQLCYLCIWTFLLYEWKNFEAS
jgi:hypothetical protein